MTPGNYILSDYIVTLSNNKKKSIKTLLYRWEIIAIAVPVVITAKIAIEQIIMLTRK